jgi:hypothetical protein
MGKKHGRKKGNDTKMRKAQGKEREESWGMRKGSYPTDGDKSNNNNNNKCI